MAGIKFDITADNSNFMRRLEETKNGVRNTAKQIEQSGLGIEELFSRISRAAAMFGAGFTATEFVKQVASIRGEFQKLEVAFNTMLGSREKADALMAQLVKTAATTPFDLQGVANGARQLLAYGDNVENVNEDLIRLGNIAAGLSIPLGDLVYLYGTTMTQGRLYTQDLNQFTGRGIPMIRELAKQFGVAEGKVRELVEQGKIGFPEVQKVIQSLTNEGGMFYDLMEEQSRTISGQIANIQDAFEMMLNDIGKANEGIFNEALSTVSNLLENYEKVGKVLLEIVATYGAYRAALMAVTALHSLYATGITTLTVKEAAYYGWLVLVKKGQDALNASMLANPYVLAAAALTALGYGLYKYMTRMDEADRMQERFNKRLEEQNKLSAERKAKSEELINTIKEESNSDYTRNKALQSLKAMYPKIFEQYDIEKVKLTELLELKKQIAVIEENTAYSADKSHYTELLKQRDKLDGELSYRSSNYGNGQYKYAEFYGMSVNSLKKQRKEISKEIDTLYATIQEKSNAIWETTPKEVKIASLKQNIADLKKEKAALESTINGKGTLEMVSAIDITRLEEVNRLIKEQESEVESLQKAAKSTTSTSTAELKKATEQAAALQKEIDALRSGTATDVSGGKSVANQIEEKEKELKALKETIATLTGKTEKESVSESRKSLERQEQVAEQLLQLRRETEQAEIDLMKDGTEKKIAQIELNYQRQIDAVRKQEKEWRNEQNGTLTSEQQAAIGESYNAAWLSKDKATGDIEKAQLKADEEAMNAYLAEYGSYLEKREALKAQYEAKAAKEGASDWEKMSLQKELEASLAALDTEQLKKSINWEQVFGDLGKVTESSLVGLKDKLKEFMSGNDGLSTEAQKEIASAITAIEAELSSRNPIEAMSRSFTSLRSATEEVKKAQEGYNKALKGGTDEEKKNAKETLLNAQNKKQASLKEATDALHNGVADVQRYVGAANDILGIFSDLGVKMPEWLEGTVGGMSTVLDGLSSIDLTKPASMISGAATMLRGAVQTMASLGGLIGGESDKTLAKDIERLTASNETLTTAIDNLADKMEESSVADASGLYEQQMEYFNEVVKNTREMMQRSADAYKSGFGGKHSSSYYVDKALDNADWRRISSLVGATVDSSDRFFNLTSQQMADVAAYLPDLYQKIKDAADDGYRDAAKYMDDYVSYYEQIEELKDTYREKLTSTSFDDVKSNFRSALLDMEDDTEAFANSFTDIMQDALMEIMMTGTYDKKLRTWYDNFASMVESDGKLTTEEMDKLRAEYDAIAEEAKGTWDAYREMFNIGTNGSSSSSSATTGAFQTMSQDSADELNGRFTALQLAGEDIRRQAVAAVTYMAEIASASTSDSSTLSEIRTLMVYSNGYLEDIAKYNKRIYEGFGQKLDDINNNIKNVL